MKLKGLFVVALALTPACGSANSGTTSTSGSSSVPTADAFFAAFADQACTAMPSCTLVDSTLKLRTKEGCLALFGSQLFTKAKEYIADGTIKYDPAAGAACLAATKTDCAGLMKMGDVPVCRKALAGTLADGKTCSESAQCQSDFCATKDYTCSTGVCKARVAAGAACAPQDQCLEGLRCVAGKCASDAPAKLGESCTDLSCADGAYCDFAASGKCVAQKPAGADCSGSDECAAPNFCNGDKAGKCAPLPPEGQPCKWTDGPKACANGLVCVATSALASGTCKKPTAMGAACTSSTECGGIDVGCIGDSAKKCAVLPGKGQPCKAPDAVTLEVFTCLLPYTCSKGVCSDPPGADQDCAAITKSCAEGLLCDSATTKCKARPGNGEPCPGYECAPNFTCDSSGGSPGTCKPSVCQ